ncbi:TPA: WxL domain-containing protein, partial [Enterococcus faecalis]|nr:WxL domain-containing protein [Enterococcus faecalis]
MKQIKFKQLATFGLCCSLLGNSLTGVTAVAETVTIESSPTAESTKESTQKSESSKQAETTEATEETVNNDTESREQSTTQESVKNEEPKQIEEKPQEVPDLLQNRTIGMKAGNLASAQQQIKMMIANKNFTTSNTLTIPQVTVGLNIKPENNEPVQMTDFNLTANMISLDLSTADSIGNSLKKAVTVNKVTDGFEVIVPSVFLNLNASQRRRYLDDIIFQVPKYIDDVKINAPRAYLWSGGILGLNDFAEIAPAMLNKLDSSRFQIGSYESLSLEGIGGVSKINVVQHYYSYRANNADAVNVGVWLPKNDYTLSIIHKKVTENFKDVNGTAIPAPTGFTQGKKTSITNNDYTFKQSGTLPSTYKASNGKTYQLKGWYKGNTKPATLSTGTPTYKVSYDGNDDLNVIYEEVVPKTVTVPAVDYLFGFINEKGVYDYDAKLTATITEVSGGTVKNGSAITSVPEGVFQKLTIPSKTLTYTETSPTYYGVTKANVQVPKYYKQPTVKPGSYFTGPVGGYPMATIALQNITNGQKSNASVDGSRFDVVPNESAKPNNYLLVSNSWANDTTKTAFSKALSMTTTVNAPSFYTTEDKMFYFLENRRVTENFVDSNGTEITPPTGFTQGKKTVIDSNDFTYTSDKALPATYSADGKSYRLKGWYKGKDKPPTLSTGTPTYKVTYDDNDDLTVVYDEAKVTLPGYTYQFGFVDEAGQLINPELVNLTYDMWFFEDKIETILEKSVKATNSGDLKEMTIADKVVKEPTAETLGENT